MFGQSTVGKTLATFAEKDETQKMKTNEPLMRMSITIHAAIALQKIYLGVQ